MDVIAHYKLNDNAASSTVVDDIGVHNGNYKDGSGNINTSTGANTGVGSVGTALDFDGDEYIEIADHADFTPALTPFSISAWVYMHDATNFMIATKGEFGTDGEWVLFTNGNDELVFNMFDEDASACIGQKSNTSLTSYENIWIHIVVTSDGGTANSGIKLHINGIQVDDTDDGGGSFVAVENLTSPVDIGRYAI